MFRRQFGVFVPALGTLAERALAVEVPTIDILT
jgi:hypothetical protein